MGEGVWGLSRGCTVRAGSQDEVSRKHTCPPAWRHEDRVSLAPCDVQTWANMSLAQEVTTWTTSRQAQVGTVRCRKLRTERDLQRVQSWLS